MERPHTGTVLAGATNGVLTGMTGSYVVPGVLYLQALGMPRDTFVQAMGVLFTVSTLALGASLAGYGLLPADLTGLSAAALTRISRSPRPRKRSARRSEGRRATSVPATSISTAISTCSSRIGRRPTGST